MDKSSEVRIVSSMATRRLLTDLTTRFEATSEARVALESIGGVDAAKRVRAGEPFDIVVLAGDVIDALTTEGHIVAGSRVNVAASAVGVAVRSGTPHPDISSANGVRDAVRKAKTVGYSTGPSGTYLASLFRDWGIADEIKDRIVVATPGVPVASLVARGDLELGFQQLSELMDVEGIDIVGLLPADIQSVTIFAGGVATTSAQPERAREVLTFMGGSAVADVKRRYGMEPA